VAAHSSIWSLRDSPCGRNVNALTSDRPYRPRMNDSDALSVLVQRRGTMYDPLVIDTFMRSWQQLAAETASAADEPKPSKTSRSSQTLQVPTHPAEGAVRAAMASPLDQLLEAAVSKTGASLAILFATDLDADRLLSVASRTSDGPARELISMPLGSGVSGWVAVNGTPILNAEAALDVRQTQDGVELVRIVCVPIRVRGHSVGVLSLYSNDRRGFNEEDKTLVQQLVAGLDAEEPSRIFDSLLQARRAAVNSPPTIH